MQWLVKRCEFKKLGEVTRLTYGRYCARSIKGHSKEAWDTLTSQRRKLNRMGAKPTTRAQVREFGRKTFKVEERSQDHMDLIMRQSKTS